jgi:Flp pilus assembly protein TadG
MIAAISHPARRARRWLAALADETGIAAIEFALLLPVLGLIVAGITDFGGVLLTRFRLDAAVSAGANYAMVNASNVSSANGAKLANTISTVVANNAGSTWANDAIVVNNGPAQSMTGGTSSTGGTASNADSCYCPSVSSGFAWGAAVTCGNACGGGGIAGKFVTITAARTFAPIFSGYGLVTNNTISVTTAVQTQ